MILQLHLPGKCHKGCWLRRSGHIVRVAETPVTQQPQGPSRSAGDAWYPSPSSRAHRHISRRHGAAPDGDAHSTSHESSNSPVPQRQLSLSLGCSEATARALAGRQPQLATVKHLARLSTQCKLLSQDLYISLDEAAIMISRQPALLTTSPRLLLGQAQELAACLGLPLHVVTPLLAKQPEFLEISPEKLSGRCSHLAEILGLMDKWASAGPEAAAGKLQLPYSGSTGTSSSSSSTSSSSNTSVVWQHPGLPVGRSAGGSPSGSTVIPSGTSYRGSSTPHSLTPPTHSYVPIGSRARSTSPPRAPTTQHHQQHQQRRQQDISAQLIQMAAKAEALKVLTRLQPSDFFSFMLISTGELSKRLLLLEAALGAFEFGAVAGMVAKCPSLVVLPVDEVKRSQAQLTSILQVPPAKVNAVLGRSPHLLTLPSSSLRHSFAALQQLLGLQARQVASRAVQQPGLLMWTPQAVQEYASALSRILGLSLQEVRSVLRNQINLMSYQPDTLVSKMAQLAAVLQATDEQVRDAVVLQPSLLSLSVASVDAKLAALEALMQWSRSRVSALVLAQPSLLTQSTLTLQRKLDALADTTGLSRRECKELVETTPTLLAMPSVVLSQRLSELALASGVPLQAVQSVLAVQPEVVLQGPVEEAAERVWELSRTRGGVPSDRGGRRSSQQPVAGRQGSGRSSYRSTARARQQEGTDDTGQSLASSEGSSRYSEGHDVVQSDVAAAIPAGSSDTTASTTSDCDTTTSNSSRSNSRGRSAGNTQDEEMAVNQGTAMNAQPSSSRSTSRLNSGGYDAHASDASTGHAGIAAGLADEPTEGSYPGTTAEQHPPPAKRGRRQGLVKRKPAGSHSKPSSAFLQPPATCLGDDGLSEKT